MNESSRPLTSAQLSEVRRFFAEGNLAGTIMYERVVRLVDELRTWRELAAKVRESLASSGVGRTAPKIVIEA